MTIRVEIEGQKPIEFPDGTDDAVIQQTVNRITGPQEVEAPIQQPQERGVFNVLGDIAGGLNRLSPSRVRQQQKPVVAKPPLQTVTDIAEFGLETIKNIPRSGAEFATNLFTALSPIKTKEGKRPIFETLKGIGELAKGTVQLAIPGEQGSEDFARAFGGFISDRYGSEDAFFDTLKNDPVGVAADFSGFFTGLGGITKVAAGLSKANKLKVIAGNLLRIGDGLDPVNIAVKGIPAIGGGKIADTLIKTASNFKGSFTLERIDELANFQLANGINVGRKSLTKVKNDIRGLQNKINNIISRKTKDGVVVRTESIIDSLEELKNNVAFGSPERRVIDNMKNDFLKLNGTELTPGMVQRIKVEYGKDFDSKLTDRFGKVRTKVRDKIRQSARQQLEQISPELKSLNADEGVLINLDEAITSQIKIFEKKQPVTLRGLILGSLGGGAAVGTGADILTTAQTAAGIIAADKIITSPRVQSALAVALKKSRVNLLKSGIPIRSLRPAFQAGRVQDLTQQQPQGTQSTLGNR